MLDRIKDRILQTGRACGLEISLLGNEDIIIQLVTLKLERNKITKEKEVPSLSIADLKNHITPGSPVAVVLNGKGILHKKVPPEAVTESLFESILPNGNPAEFYMQVCQYESFALAYIIRRSVLDKIIDSLFQQRISVVALSLGTTDIQYAMPYINFEKDAAEIRTSHFLLHMRPQGTIVNIETIPFTAGEVRPAVEYSIGNYYVFARGMMAFSAAMGLFAGSMRQSPGVMSARILSEREEYTYYRYFKTASWAFLGSLFVILLVNFFLYNYYYSRNEEQQASAALGRAEASQVEKLQSTVLSKERFIGQYGWGHSSRISFYADRIAALVPDDALLTALRINPVHIPSSAEGGHSLFQDDTIQLTGTCGNPAELNRFTNNLRNIRNFREVDIKSYLYKKEAQAGVFTIEIVTR